MKIMAKKGINGVENGYLGEMAISMAKITGWLA